MKHFIYYICFKIWYFYFPRYSLKKMAITCFQNLSSPSDRKNTYHSLPLKLWEMLKFRNFGITLFLYLLWLPHFPKCLKTQNGKRFALWCCRSRGRTVKSRGKADFSEKFQSLAWETILGFLRLMGVESNGQSYSCKEAKVIFLLKLS